MTQVPRPPPSTFSALQAGAAQIPGEKETPRVMLEFKVRQPPAEDVLKLSEYQSEFEILVNAGDFSGQSYEGLRNKWNELHAFIQPGKTYRVRIAVEDVDSE